MIKTDKKGFGLRADTDLDPHDFVFEYIGEVINEGAFRKRMVEYDEEGIKHFYFMSLHKNVFVDATKRGNLGRFCNHSCNPNCYVDKWVVGDKMRMGIFTERAVKAGEELVFNYNVDRYGADPQPCYCGEPNCTGFLGGKTQTERATKLTTWVQEALGIEDGDGWDTAVAKRPRKKKSVEDDEEYVGSVEAKPLDETGVNQIITTLRDCQEKWIVVKVLNRVQRCESERVRNQLMRVHGYQTLKLVLSRWKEELDVAIQVLDILEHLPRLTRNKILGSKIEAAVETFTSCGDEAVEERAASLLKEWAELETGYRIPRKKGPLNGVDRPERMERRVSERFDDRELEPVRQRSESPEILRGTPNGPRGGFGQRGTGHFNGPPRPRRPPPPALPRGWYEAQHEGKNYYYTYEGETQWIRPTQPSMGRQKMVASNNQRLQAIIDNITKEEPKPKAKVVSSATAPLAVVESTKEKAEPREKWRSMSEEKQKKLYENTVRLPSVMSPA